MRWKDLKREFETVRQVHIDAHWRYAPRESPNETWRLVLKTKSRSALEAEALIERAGVLLDGALRGTRWAPARLASSSHSPAEHWLAAVRRQGFNVEHSRPSEWRTEEGTIEDVVGASITLCEHLAASVAANAALDKKA